MKYSFDELKKLYKEDKEKFEKITQDLIEEFISNSPHEDMLRKKQWKIEQELNKIKNPIERLNKMISIFWEGVYKFKDVLDGNITSNNKNNILKFKDKEKS